MVDNHSVVFAEHGAVILSINGYHGLEDARNCVFEVVRLFREHRYKHFICDLRQMNGFDSQARVIWQEQLAELKKHIAGLTMVGGSPLARMSGAAVCLYAGIKMGFADTLEQAIADAASRRSA